MQEWLMLQNGWVLYMTLFFLLMGGAVGLPIPEDIPLIFAGILAHNGNGDIGILFIVCYSGILLGDLFIYSVGRKIGPALYSKSWFRRRISRSKIQGIKNSLERRSLSMIFLARHLFYLRTVTFLICGAVRMSFRRFLFADATAALVSAPLMMWLGYAGAHHYDAVMAAIGEAKYWTLMIGSVVILLLAYLYFRRKRLSRQEPLEPEIAPGNPLEDFHEESNGTSV